jgi:hypothetical protein
MRLAAPICSNGLTPMQVSGRIAKEPRMNFCLSRVTRSPFRQGAVAIGVGAVLALASGAASAVDVEFVGGANGCFGLACVPPMPGGVQTDTFGGLTFTSSTFDVTSAGTPGFASIGNIAGTPNHNNLGSFTLAGTPFVYDGGHFDLRVTFTLPLGTTPNTWVFTDTLTGQVGTTNNGGVFIDFDNTPKHFTFGSGGTAGSFDFFINDVSVTTTEVAAVTGSIRNVTLVPEPETYALFLAGLGALGFMSRRRRS